MNLEEQRSLYKRDHLEFTGDHIMLMLLELDRNSKAGYLFRPVCCGNRASHQNRLKNRQDHAQHKKGFECCCYSWEKGWVIPVGQHFRCPKLSNAYLDHCLNVVQW